MQTQFTEEETMELSSIVKGFVRLYIEDGMISQSMIDTILSPIRDTTGKQRMENIKRISEALKESKNNTDFLKKMGLA